MKLNTTIALAAIATVLAVPGVAQAAPAHHHHKKVAKKAVAKKAEGEAAEQGLTTGEQLTMAQQQLAQLQAQVSDLQARLNKAPAPAAETTAAVAAADAKADKALALAAKNDAELSKTDKKVASMAWAADTKISGRMYADFSHIDASTGGVKNAGSGTGFNIKRMYIGIDHRFSKVFAFNVTTDVSNVVGSTSNYNYSAPSSFGSPIGRGFYIKKAYAEAKIDPALIIRAGSADLPWVPYDEGIYGYRHIENTIVDGPFGTSADWGIHVLGDLGKHLDYQVSVINGAGYRNVKVSRNVDVEGRIGAHYANLFAAVGGYAGKRGNATQGATNVYHTARRFDVMAGYKSSKFTLGGEYFYAKDWNNVTTLGEDSANGFTIFSNYNVTPKWSVFGKYEEVQPYRITNSALHNHYFNVGIQYEPVKMFDVALVVKRDAINNTNGTTSANSALYGTYANDAFTANNGTLTALPNSNATFTEVGVFGQFRW